MATKSKGKRTMRRFAEKLYVWGMVAVLLFILAGCREMSGPSSADDKIILWNGKDFTGWKLFVPDQDIDVNNVWSVRNGVIYCSGKPNGYMRTKDKYENYYLHLEWRWPSEPANSGVLLHASGPDKLWPRAIECQLKAGSAGDFVLMNGTGITIDGENKQNPKQQFVVIPKKAQSSEKPAGQWNTYDIYCEADTIRCYVNGVLQNEGTAVTDTSGWICLQSEGGPVEFRYIYEVPYRLLKK
jgi:hypothetical protein